MILSSHETSHGLLAASSVSYSIPAITTNGPRLISFYKEERMDLRNISVNSI